MKKYVCNPVNINYRYQFNMNMRNNNAIEVAREAADPSMIYFQGKYWIFASMTLGVWMSEDLVHFENYRLPENLPLYDYAPDVRVIGEYVYFSASKRSEICDFYRTKNILEGPYEEIKGTFDFWDPHLYADEDGRVYFYWGCSNVTPLLGVELDPITMLPIGEKQALIYGNVDEKGFECCGEDHSERPVSGEELEQRYAYFLQRQGNNEENIPQDLRKLIKGMLSNEPFIEGAWVNKHYGKYYLQYAFNGTQYNVYGDGVYIGDSPLGPYILAKNNPYSYKPGGFIPGAGHGSTMEDVYGNLWHTSTMRISMNHQFERRVGIWKAGFDEDGELFCNQRYGDWPMEVEEVKADPWKDPEWYLLSYNKPVICSSNEEGKGPENATDENVQTWWRAANSKKGEWIELDLSEQYDVRAIQLNFADDKIEIPVPGEIRGTTQARYIEEATYYTRWKLEGSVDGIDYEIIEDKSEADTDLTHDLVVLEEGKHLRYLRLTVLEVPYDQPACISGFRVFGIGNGEKPEQVEFEVERTSDTSMNITIEPSRVVGYNILWGHDANKLYHSCMCFDSVKEIKALVKDESYFVRVDTFNENGITQGKTFKLK